MLHKYAWGSFPYTKQDSAVTFSGKKNQYQAFVIAANSVPMTNRDNITSSHTTEM